MSSDTEWLANLKVGDEVAVPFSMGRGHDIFPITGETATCWKIADGKYRKSDGLSIGVPRLHRVMLRRPTDMMREEIRRNRATCNIQAAVSTSKLASVPTDRIEQALALLTPEGSTP